MDQEFALQCKELRKRYGQHTVLQGVNLAVPKGSIYGLVGLNGAGKTTTLECILGLQPNADGDISVLGYHPEKLHEAKGRVAVVFDSPYLHPQLTVRQCLTFASLQSVNTSLPINDVEKLLGIERYSAFKVRQLSLGNRRRTAIAQALINQPQFVILDEPFNGLDASGVDDVLALIRRLNKEQGTSFLLASHQLAYLEKICTHVAILHSGKIRISENLDAILAQDQSTVTIITDNTAHAITVLKQIPNVTLLPNNDLAPGIHCRLQGITSAELNTKLVQANVAVEQLMLQKPSLESIFNTTVSQVAA